MSEQSVSLPEDVPAKKPKKDNPINNLLIDVVLPALILSKLSKEDRLGPAAAIMLAFAFPLFHGLFGLWKDRKFGIFPTVGVISVALSGSLTLLKIDPAWIAVKEAAVPGFLGLAVLFSLKTKFPFVKKILFNDTILNMPAIEERLQTAEQKVAIEQLLKQTSWFISLSFFLSSFLNYTLAKILLVSAPGTPAFNEDLGKMQLMSYPVIVVPCMIVMALSLWFMLRGIKAITGLETDNLLRAEMSAKEAEAAKAAKATK